MVEDFAARTVEAASGKVDAVVSGVGKGIKWLSNLNMGLTIFLLAFQVVPIAYTINVAFTNYSTGHILTKSEAIDGILTNTLAPPADGKSFLMTPARDTRKIANQSRSARPRSTAGR